MYTRYILAYKYMVLMEGTYPAGTYPAGTSPSFELAALSSRMLDVLPSRMLAVFSPRMLAALLLLMLAVHQYIACYPSI